MSIESAKVISLVSEPKPKLKSEESESLVRAQVNNVEEGASASSEVVVSLGGKPVKAQVSFSCLVQPQADDTVLIAGDEASGYFVLSILERKGSQAMSLNFPDSAQLNCEQGNLSLHSTEAVQVSAPQYMNLSQENVLKSNQLYVKADKVFADGQEAQVNFASVSLITKMLNTLAKHAMQKFQTYVRKSEGMDQVKASKMIRNVDGLYTMDSKYTVMVSEKDTKIDAQRIHMG